MKQRDHRVDRRATAKVREPRGRVKSVGPHQQVLRLQRLAGNAAVAEFLAAERVLAGENTSVTGMTGAHGNQASIQRQENQDDLGLGLTPPVLPPSSPAGGPLPVYPPKLELSTGSGEQSKNIKNLLPTEEQAKKAQAQTPSSLQPTPQPTPQPAGIKLPGWMQWFADHLGIGGPPDLPQEYRILYPEAENRGIFVKGKGRF